MEQHVLQTGSVVSIDKILYRHVGIDTGDGRVIHASKKKGIWVWEPVGEFSEGKPIRYEGYPGNLPGDEVVGRAARLVGRRYNLFTNNCEHLVTEAHGLPRQSSQLRGWAFAVSALLLVSVLAKKTRVV